MSLWKLQMWVAQHHGCNTCINVGQMVKDNNENLSQLCDLVERRLKAVDSRLGETKVSSWVIYHDLLLCETLTAYSI
jgi:hypothetical protein